MCNKFLFMEALSLSLILVIFIFSLLAFFEPLVFNKIPSSLVLHLNNPYFSGFLLMPVMSLGDLCDVGVEKRGSLQATLQESPDISKGE